MDGYHSTVVFLEGVLGVHWGTGVLTHSHMVQFVQHTLVGLWVWACSTQVKGHSACCSKRKAHYGPPFPEATLVQGWAIPLPV